MHRDVKPHNLLVFADGSVRLGDFGTARALADGHTRTRTGALLGSIPFMAPEQRRDPRAVRPSTDVYALAVTLAWILLGEAPDDPWTEEAAAQLRAAGVPEGLVAAVGVGGARRAQPTRSTGTTGRGGGGPGPAPRARAAAAYCGSNPAARTVPVTDRSPYTTSAPVSPSQPNVTPPVPSPGSRTTRRASW